MILKVIGKQTHFVEFAEKEHFASHIRNSCQKKGNKHKNLVPIEIQGKNNKLFPKRTLRQTKSYRESYN